ncbi:MAG TPA: AraC family transcriptional regulator [Steroidobacteraceae bacterium]|nr:AraC family transcriptional regulator [Steroidobacteraceae bacterium]
MDYQEYPVPETLRQHVACVWRLRDATPAGAVHTIYPDGRCELLVHLLAPPRCWDPVSGWHRQAPSLFAAQRVTAVRLAFTGPLDCIGLRLQPAASAAIARQSLAESRDRIVDLAGIDRSLCRSLRAAARAFARGADAALWRLLLRRVACQTLDPRIVTAAKRIELSAGKTRIDATARASGMSLRGFQTRFRAETGLTPKEFARLTRLQATLRALDADHASLAELAAEGGFADQAHATRELLRATGLTPARLRAELRRDRHSDAAVHLAAAFVRGHSR